MADPSSPEALPLRAELVLDGEHHDALELTLAHALSDPGEASVTLEVAQERGPGAWLGRGAVLALVTPGAGRHAAFAGEVIAAREARAGRGWRVTLTLAPRLLRLAEGAATRVFRRVALDALIARLLADHGLGREHWRLALGEESPAAEWLLQPGEDDLAFLQRRLAAAGVFTFTEPGEAGEVTVFADHNAAGGHIGAVRYRPHGGLGTAPGEASALTVVATRPPLPTARHVAASPPAERGRACPEAARGRVRHRAPAADARAARAAARLEDEAHAARARRVHLTGALPALRPGVSLWLEAPTHPVAAATGDYLVVAVRQRFAPGAALDGGPERGALTTEAELAPLDRPWRPAPVPPPELPAVIAARIEADIPDVALIDDEGAYRARAHADAGDHAHTDASPGLRLLTPYASPTEAGEPAGWHFPLQGGSEVLVSCLDGDPDRPCLVGFAPAAGQAGPVTGNNASENTLRTPAGNRLTLDDARGAEAVVLETFQGRTLLRLDARQEAELVRLACAEGAALARAGRDARLVSGADLAERAGASRRERIGERHTTRTAAGALRREARAASARVAAAEGVTLTADGRLDVAAGGHLCLDAEDSASVRIDGPGGLAVRVREGEVHASAAEAIEITGEGGGDIVFEQNGAGFAILADGTVRLFGKAVSLSSGNGAVALNGPVSYRVPGTPTATPAAEARPTPPERPTEIPDPATAVLTGHGLAQAEIALTDAQGTSRDTLPAWYATRGYRPGHGPVRLTLRRESEGERAVLTEAEHTPPTPDGAHELGLPAPAPGAGAVALRVVPGERPEAITLEAATDSETRTGSARYTLHRAVSVRLTERSAGAPPITGATLVLEDTDGGEHRARVRDGEAHFPAVPLGRFRLRGEDAAGASLALVAVNGLTLPPGAQPWLREDDLAALATRLEVSALPAPMVVNLREADDPASRPWRRHRLTDAELDYCHRQGGSATLVVHGYNVGLGRFGPALAAGPVTHRHYRGHPRNREPVEETVRGLVPVEGEACGYVDPEALRAAFPDCAWDHAALDAFRQAEPLNGEHALSWLCAIEGVLNRAAAGGAIDYTRYQRVIGVTWSGDVGRTRFWACERNASAAGRRLVTLLLQLHDAGIRVNLIAHSLGARVALTALNAVAQLRERPAVTQCFLWQPAVSAHALEPEPGPRDPIGHAHFPDAHRGAERLVVLHTTHDGILGGRPDEQHGDPEDGSLEDWAEEIGGLYPKKYWLSDGLAQPYFHLADLSPGARRRARRLHNRAPILEQLSARLQREAELARLRPDHRRGERPLPALDLLLPWGREADFPPATLRAIEARLMALLEDRSDLPNEIAPAMGWDGPVNDVGTRARELFQNGRLDIIDQGDLLTSHAGMKYPDERLFREIYVNVIWERYLSEVGFGEY